MISDYGYDLARDCCRVITALSTIPASMAGAKIVHSFAYEGNAMGNATRGILTALAVTFGGPIAVHLIGTFAINNFGGLGGGAVRSRACGKFLTWILGHQNEQ